jgi:hypothetical protein
MSKRINIVRLDNDMIEMIHIEERSVPEKQLWFAVINRAVHDLNDASRTIRREASAFFRSKDFIIVLGYALDDFTYTHEEARQFALRCFQVARKERGKRRKKRIKY